MRSRDPTLRRLGRGASRRRRDRRPRQFASDVARPRRRLARARCRRQCRRCPGSRRRPVVRRRRSRQQRRARRRLRAPWCRAWPASRRVLGLSSAADVRILLGGSRQSAYCNQALAAPRDESWQIPAHSGVTRIRRIGPAVGHGVHAALEFGSRRASRWVACAADCHQRRPLWRRGPKAQLPRERLAAMPIRACAVLRKFAPLLGVDRRLDTRQMLSDLLERVLHEAAAKLLVGQASPPAGSRSEWPRRTRPWARLKGSRVHYFGTGMSAWHST